MERKKLGSRKRLRLCRPVTENPNQSIQIFICMENYLEEERRFQNELLRSFVLTTGACVLSQLSFWQYKGFSHSWSLPTWCWSLSQPPLPPKKNFSTFIFVQCTMCTPPLPTWCMILTGLVYVIESSSSNLGRASSSFSAHMLRKDNIHHRHFPFLCCLFVSFSVHKLRQDDHHHCRHTSIKILIKILIAWSLLQAARSPHTPENWATCILFDW